MLYRVLIVVASLLVGCGEWHMSAGHSTEVELSDDLTPEQTHVVRAAVEEINAAVGQEVFYVADAHPGSNGHVTVTAGAPSGVAVGETLYYRHHAELRLGTAESPVTVMHELLHVVFGAGAPHSDDPNDVFYARFGRNQVLTDATVNRVVARLGVDARL